MNFRNRLIALGVLVGLSGASQVQAYIDSSECGQKFCKDQSSASQFFHDDANEDTKFDPIEPTQDLVSIPVSGKFWPVAGVITGQFGLWRGHRGRGHVHAGVDIAAPHGTSIVAPIKGVVSFVGRKGGYGLALVIDHGDGISTLYGHTSNVFVSEGEEVTKGQEIGKVGSSGHSTGPHLHYEVRLEGRPVNPLAWTSRLQSEKF